MLEQPIIEKSESGGINHLHQSTYSGSCIYARNLNIPIKEFCMKKLSSMRYAYLLISVYTIVDHILQQFICSLIRFNDVKPSNCIQRMHNMHVCETILLRMTYVV